MLSITNTEMATLSLTQESPITFESLCISLEENIPDQKQREILIDFISQLQQGTVTRKFLVFEGAGIGCNGKTTVIKRMESYLNKKFKMCHDSTTDHGLISLIDGGVVRMEYSENLTNKMYSKNVTTKSLMTLLSPDPIYYRPLYQEGQDIVPSCNVILQKQKSDLIPEYVSKLGGIIIDFPYNFNPHDINPKFQEILLSMSFLPTVLADIILEYYY